MLNIEENINFTIIKRSVKLFLIKNKRNIKTKNLRLSRQIDSIPVQNKRL